VDIYMLPFVKGTAVWVTQGNNSRYSHFGKAAYAFDYSLGPQDEGTLLLAAAGGTVDKAKEDTPDDVCGGEAYAGRGNYLVIRHEDGFGDLYMHLKHGSVSEFGLSVGTQVVRGQAVARMGKTGYTDCRAHLHFQRQYGGASFWQQSVPVVFGDVPGDGVPKEGQRYVSQNEMEQPSSLKESLRNATSRQAQELLQPAQSFQSYAQQRRLGAPLSCIARLSAPDGRQYLVQVFEADTVYVYVAPPGSPADWTDVRSMNALLIQDCSDEWGLALWRHTYSSVGAEFHPGWASHQYVLNQLATRPLGAPLGGGDASGVHTLIVGGKRYEAEVYASDTIYWSPPNWGDIRRLSELEE
jgi:hypothetical protein